MQLPKRKENKDRKRKYDLEYQAAHREKILAQKRARAAATREEKRAYDKARYAEKKAGQTPRVRPTEQDILDRRKRKAEKARIKAREWAAKNRDKKRAQDARYYAVNKDRIRAYTKEYISVNLELVREKQKAHYRKKRQDPEFVESERARGAIFRKMHKDHLNAKTREWRRQNREKHLAEKRAYYAAHPEEYKASSNVRRGRKFAAEGSHTKVDLAEIRKAQRNRCAYCGCKLGRKGHADHIISLSRGGTNWPRNMQWLCAPCNLSKNAKDPIDFARSKGFLL